MVDKALLGVYELHLSSHWLKTIRTLIMRRNNIPKVTFILILATKKRSSKRWDFLSLSSIEKEAITILNVSSRLSSIFWASISVLCTQKSRYSAKLGHIVLISLPKSVKAFITYISNWARYWMLGTHWSSRKLASVLAFILVFITNIEITKTNTSFVASYQDTCLCSGRSCDM